MYNNFDRVYPRNNLPRYLHYARPRNIYRALSRDSGASPKRRTAPFSFPGRPLALKLRHWGATRLARALRSFLHPPPLLFEPLPRAPSHHSPSPSPPCCVVARFDGYRGLSWPSSPLRRPSRPPRARFSPLSLSLSRPCLPAVDCIVET